MLECGQNKMKDTQAPPPKATTTTTTETKTTETKTDSSANTSGQAATTNSGSAQTSGQTSGSAQTSGQTSGSAQTSGQTSGSAQQGTSGSQGTTTQTTTTQSTTTQTQGSAQGSANASANVSANADKKASVSVGPATFSGSISFNLGGNAGGSGNASGNASGQTVTPKTVETQVNLDIGVTIQDLEKYSSYTAQKDNVCAVRYEKLLQLIPDDIRATIINEFKNAKDANGSCCINADSMTAIRTALVAQQDRYIKALNKQSQNAKKGVGCYVQTIAGKPTQNKEKYGNDANRMEKERIMFNIGEINNLNHYLAKCLVGLNKVLVQNLANMCFDKNLASNIFKSDSTGAFTAPKQSHDYEAQLNDACKEYIQRFDMNSQIHLTQFHENLNYISGTEKCNYFANTFNWSSEDDKDPLNLPPISKVEGLLNKVTSTVNNVVSTVTTPTGAELVRNVDPLTKVKVRNVLRSFTSNFSDSALRTGLQNVVNNSTQIDDRQAFALKLKVKDSSNNQESLLWDLLYGKLFRSSSANLFLSCENGQCRLEGDGLNATTFELLANPTYNNTAPILKAQVTTKAQVTSFLQLRQAPPPKATTSETTSSSTTTTTSSDKSSSSNQASSSTTAQPSTTSQTTTTTTTTTDGKSTTQGQAQGQGSAQTQGQAQGSTQAQGQAQGGMSGGVSFQGSGSGSASGSGNGSSSTQTTKETTTTTTSQGGAQGNAQGGASGSASGSFSASVSVTLPTYKAPPEDYYSFTAEKLGFPAPAKVSAYERASAVFQGPIGYVNALDFSTDADASLFFDARRYILRPRPQSAKGFDPSVYVASLTDVKNYKIYAECSKTFCTVFVDSLVAGSGKVYVDVVMRNWAFVDVSKNLAQESCLIDSTFTYYQPNKAVVSDLFGNCNFTSPYDISPIKKACGDAFVRQCQKNGFSELFNRFFLGAKSASLGGFKNCLWTNTTTTEGEYTANTREACGKEIYDAFINNGVSIRYSALTLPNTFAPTTTSEVKTTFTAKPSNTASRLASFIQAYQAAPSDPNYVTPNSMTAAQRQEYQAAQSNAQSGSYNDIAIDGSTPTKPSDDKESTASSLIASNPEYTESSKSASSSRITMSFTFLVMLFAAFLF